MSCWPRSAAAPVVLLAAPLTIVAGAGVAATGRSRATRVEREVGRVLDAVDQHARPARLRVDVVRRVAGRPRRAVTPVSFSGGW